MQIYKQISSYRDYYTLLFCALLPKELPLLIPSKSILPGVQHEEGVLSIHPYRWAFCTHVGQGIMPPHIHLWIPRHLKSEDLISHHKKMKYLIYSIATCITRYCYWLQILVTRFQNVPGYIKQAVHKFLFMTWSKYVLLKQIINLIQSEENMDRIYTLL